VSSILETDRVDHRIILDQLDGETCSLFECSACYVHALRHTVELGLEHSSATRPLPLLAHDGVSPWSLVRATPKPWQRGTPAQSISVHPPPLSSVLLPTIQFSPSPTVQSVGSTIQHESAVTRFLLQIKAISLNQMASLSTLTRRLHNRVAIVTGASSGIGRAIALAYAHHGAKVVCADLNKLSSRQGEASISTADLIVQSGGTALYHEVDVGSDESVDALMSKTVSNYERLDVYVTYLSLVQIV
jgi:hypothetical protein